LVNGKFEDSLSVNDRGLSFGDGVFETIRIWKSVIPFWSDHFSRLQRGLAVLGITTPESFEDSLLKDVASLISENASLCSQSAVLKIIVTRGCLGRGYLPSLDSVPTIILMIKENVYASPASNSAKEGGGNFSLICCKHPISSNPVLAGIKHLNRLDQVLASTELQDKYDEGLLLDANGYVIEGTKSNLVILKNGQWITPDLSSCGIQGVMLKRCQIWLEKRKVSLIKQPLTIKDVLQADHLFMMNSIMGIRGVTTFLNSHYSSSSKEFDQLQRWLSESYGY
jgi:4-amino-4-deoxychorismate lyase